MEHFLFFLLAIVCVGSVLGMIISKNQAYSALFLILSFVCTGGLFALLQAPFIAAVQIIIYAGAIMVLFVFVIMMINMQEGFPPERKKWTMYLSLGIAVILVIELFLAIRGALSPAAAAPNPGLGSPKELGRVLFSDYLYPFEITSVLIIAALVGAIVLVKKRESQ